MTTQEYLNAYYSSINEDERLTTPYGSVEFLTTMRYVEKYLRPNMKICEIGAATGRYAHTLARQGYEVDAVELLEHNIELFKNNTTPDEKITITQGNAVDLSMFPDNTYDITLVLGPMYHLFTKKEQLAALSDAIRITKKDGIIFAAYCIGDASVLGYGFVRGCIHDIIEKCMIDTETFATFSNPWDIFELYRKEDVDSLMQNFDVTRLHYLASDGFANYMRDTVSNMDEKTFELYLKYHFATCERQDMVGISHHTLDIFRKN